MKMVCIIGNVWLSNKEQKIPIKVKIPSLSSLSHCVGIPTAVCLIDQIKWMTGFEGHLRDLGLSFALEYISLRSLLTGVVSPVTSKLNHF